ncbi:MAG: ABC transporter permease [Bacteroidetes bacterium]|nr:ABC transporter permease [Bacteroidota bacterium]
MFLNYIKIAFRNLIKYKSTSITYLASLIIGYAGVLLIMLILKNELTFDSFHENSENIYRIVFVENEKVIKNPREIVGSGPPAGPAFKEQVTEVKDFTRIRYAENSLIVFEDKSFYEDKTAYVDSTFLTMFSFPLVFGNPEDALSKPNSVVISEKVKNKIWGNENPIGKILVLDDRHELHVTGVIKNFPLNSHIEFDYLISFNTFAVPTGYPVTLQDWGWISFPTYLLIQSGADINKIEEQCLQILKSNLSASSKERFFIKLQPLKDIYLGEYKYHRDRKGEWSKVIGLIIISFLLLGIACFNFINIATARSTNRLKEIAMRKVIGADRKSIFYQLIGESILVSLLSMLFSVLIVQTIIESKLNFIGINFFELADDFLLYSPIYFLFALAVGFLAGLYHSFIVAAFNPIKIFRNTNSFSGSKSTVRKLIITFQFSIAIFLIITSFIISKQMEYISEKNLGFDQEQILVLRLPRDNSGQNVKLISESYNNNAFVINISSTGNILDGDNGSGPVFPEGMTGDVGIPMNTYGVNFNFFETLDIKFINGRPLSADIASDSTEGIVINEKAAKILGWHDPIGKQLRVSNLLTGRIVGVVKDFHFASLHNEIQPLVMFFTDLTEYIFVKTAKGNLNSTISSLEKEWKNIVPDLPFDFFFLDENINKLYQSENIFLNLINVFSILSIFVALLGLFGLVFFSVTKKKKEIAVRKILGASVSNILFLVSHEYIMFTIVANIIAWPVAYFYLNNWLTGFAYKVEIGIIYFLFAAVIVSVCALLTVCLISFKTARSNPAESIKNE